MSFKFCPKILGERGQAAFPVSNCVLSNFTSWMTAAQGCLCSLGLLLLQLQLTPCFSF